MLPETIRLIEQAIIDSPPSISSPRVELLEQAVGAAFRAKMSSSPEETQRHTLRAIAYLVRRLELDAAETPSSGPGAG